MRLGLSSPVSGLVVAIGVGRNPWRLSPPQHAILILALFGSLATPVRCAEDAYLNELAAEVEKVREQAVSGLDATTASEESPAVGARAVGGTPEGASREAFERQLERRYLGSFRFYEQLPERSRQEVFEEYRQGADMSEIRKKIINRLLQR